MNECSKEQLRMKSYLQLVATGPELSKSLNLAQAEDALRMILDEQIDDVRSGIFLIALRMKRETDDENIGALNALMSVLNTASIQAEEVISISDPFNGYLRGIPVTAFLPAVLSACGLPAYTHGLHAVGPKYGITSHMILKTLGKPVKQSVAESAARLDDPKIGWAYLDQESMIPKLHRLVHLREVMVKRTCLSTLEVVLKPISGARQSHLMTGFVHKAYPPVYTQLAKHAGFDSAMVIRGVEGGCIPSLSQLSRYFGYSGEGDMALNKLDPKALGIDQKSRMVPLPKQYEAMMSEAGYERTSVLNPVVEHAAELGLAALQNKAGPTLDSLVYSAGIGLSHTKLASSLETAVEMAREAIASGAALEKFNAG